MNIRNLGKDGPPVSELGLGCMGMSAMYGGEFNDEESLKTLQHAVDKGITFFDTADVYGHGHNERLVGKALAGMWDQVVIATKFAILAIEDGGWMVDASPGYLRSACESSLARLGTDTIDVYYLHRLDKKIPIEDTVGAMADLVKQGKVRHIGLSEVSADTLRRAHAVHPIAALQSEYSLWTRDIETEMLPTCRELGVALVPYSPLGRGFLSGRIKTFEDLPKDDWRRTNPRFKGKNFQKNLQLVEELERMAEEKGCTTAQLALAWVLAQGEDIIPIPGTKRVKRIDENIGAADVQLTSADLQRIDDILPPGAAAGTRYSKEMMRYYDDN